MNFLKDLISLIVYMLIFFQRKKGKIVLLYHSVGNTSFKNDPYKINISLQNFERHLKVISKYKDKIELTFDDGYGNNFTNTLPLLKKYNLKATFFLVTDFMDGEIESEHIGGKSFKETSLTWDKVKVMEKAGMKFGSHSKTHRLLTNISENDLKKELLDSKKRIEEALGHEIDEFAYPFGSRNSFNDQIKKLVKVAGYNRAYTNIMGSNTIDSDNNFSLKRIRICGDDGHFKLRMKIKGAYDWVDAIGLSYVRKF